MADKTNRKIKLSDFIRTQLAKRGWTGLDFCTLLGGIPKSAGSKIANGKQAPSFRQLAILAAIFETDINDIMAMRLYEESCEDCEAYRLSGVHKRIIEIFKKVPVNELLSNHWVSVLDRNDLSEMLRAFEPYLAEAEEASGLAHKTHADDIQFTNLQKAWLLRVRNLARKRTPAGVFSKDALPQTIDLLKEAMRRNSSIADAVKILDEAGIRLVLVECKGSCIDAVCTWLDHSPVIGMTLRFDRVDNFWFVLRHELAHVEQGPSVTPIVDCNLGKEAVGELETEANKAAQEFCAPKELIEEFLASSQGRILEQDVVEFAEQHSIPPAVFAGQIRHKLQKYNMLTKLLSKYRADILNVAPVVDGWGYMRA